MTQLSKCGERAKMAKNRLYAGVKNDQIPIYNENSSFMLCANCKRIFADKIQLKDRPVIQINTGFKCIEICRHVGSLETK